MRPYSSSPAPGVGMPPHYTAPGAADKGYYTSGYTERLPPEHSSPWGSSRAESPVGASSISNSSQPSNTASFRTASSPGYVPESSVFTTASLSPSSFASAARAFAAAVASPLANHTRRCLLDALSSIVGKKLLLLDETLAGALSLLVDGPTLQQQGVDRCFPLRSYPLHASGVSPATASASLILFFCRPHLSLLPLIIQHIYFIERTYQPTRPQGSAGLASSAVEESTPGRINDSGKNSRGDRSVSPPPDIEDTRSGVQVTCRHAQDEQNDDFQEQATLACRFPVPTSFSPSGRHYFVICIPAASDFFLSEFRRLLASGPLLPSSAKLEGAGSAADHGSTGFLANAVPGSQGQEDTSVTSSGSVASLFSNLSNLPANLFGGTAFQGAAGTSVKSQVHAAGGAAFTPILSQNSATVTSCPLFFFPLAQDLLSLELPNSYRDIHLYGDRTPTQFAAAAILLLQDELLQGGLIPQLRSLGTAAKAVADQLIQHRKERQAQQTERQQQQSFPLYGSSISGAIGRPGAFSELGGWGGCHALSYGAAAAAARAYRIQIGRGNQRSGADFRISTRKEEQTTGTVTVETSGERGDFKTVTEDLVFHDPLDPNELSIPLAPLAPPARFVLSRDDLALEEEKGASLHKDRVDLSPKRQEDSALSAARAYDRSDNIAIRGRLSSEETYQEDAYRSSGEEGRVSESRERGKPHVTATRPPRAVRIDMLVLIDRRSDLITPLCTAFTYEALLDAVFGIDAAAIDVPQQLLLQQPQQQHNTAQQHVVSQAEASSSSGRSGSLLSFTPFWGGEKETETRSSKVVGVPVLFPMGARRRVSLAADGLFALLRDLHQSAVGARLHSIASGIQQTYKEKDALRSIHDISVFINKFRVKQKEHSSLSLHVRLASFLAAVTQDPAFVQRLGLEDELLQSGVSSSSSNSVPPLKSSILAQFEALLEDAASANRLWWSSDAAGTDTGKTPGGDVFTQQRLQQPQGPSSAAGTPGAGGGGGDGNKRWRGTAGAGTGLVDFYRLLCLASLVNGGLRSKQIENIRLGLLQHFGFEEVQRLALLHRVGLLRQNGGAGAAGGAAAGVDKSGSSDVKSERGVDGVLHGDAEGVSTSAGLAPGSWKTLKKECNLLTDGSEGDQAMMDSIAYACSGYAPLSVRLIEILFQQASGWRAIPHLLSLLWGPAMEVRQQQQPTAFITQQRETRAADVFAASGIVSHERTAQQQDAKGEPEVAPEDVTTVMVFFLGGITHAEVASIRRLNELELQRYHQRKLQAFGAASTQAEDFTTTLRRFVIMTTEVVNAKKLIESCVEPTSAGSSVRFPWHPCICSEDTG